MTRKPWNDFAVKPQAASALNHPNICTIHDIGEENGRPFIAMEYLDGKTLKHPSRASPAARASAGTVRSKLPTRWMRRTLKGIVHRDIKPANIFVTERGHAKILDFGLAKARPCWAATESFDDADSQRAEHLTQTWHGNWHRRYTCHPNRCGAKNWMRARICFPLVWCSTRW